jgi:hypothetical protein
MSERLAVNDYDDDDDFEDNLLMREALAPNWQLQVEVDREAGTILESAWAPADAVFDDYHRYRATGYRVRVRGRDVLHRAGGSTEFRPATIPAPWGRWNSVTGHGIPLHDVDAARAARDYFGDESP